MSIVVSGPVSLKTFRTATTLCIPDPVFNDVTRHKIIMPESSPVQREILSGVNLRSLQFKCESCKISLESDLCFGLSSLCDRCSVKLNQNCARQSEINTAVN